MAFYTTGQILAQRSAKTEDRSKNVRFSEILEENKINHFWKYWE